MNQYMGVIRMKDNIVDNLHQPEYTGENRCEPCTVLNLIIAALLGSIIARKSKLGGIVAMMISVSFIRSSLVASKAELTRFNLAA